MNIIKRNLLRIRQGSLFVVVLLSIIELAIFPSKANLIGCIITIGSVLLFNRIVLHYGILRRHPLSSMSLILLYCFMILPLPATLIDGNEISYGMIVPEITFPLQFLFLAIVLLSFYINCKKQSGGLIRDLYGIMGLFKPPTNSQLWIMGVIGLLARSLIYMLSNVGAGTLSMVEPFMFAPICILFRPLMGKRPCCKTEIIWVWSYIVVVSILMIATNSRARSLSFIATCAILYLLYLLFGYARPSLSKLKLILFTSAFFVVLGPMKDMAFAMVVVRSQRNNVSMVQLFKQTISMYNNKEKLYYLQKIASSEFENGNTNSIDWSEYYVSNIFLQRVCNYRVADASIYHAIRVGMPNDKVFDDFLIRLKLMFPTPIVNVLFGNIDKKNYKYSPMDYLYSISSHRNCFGGYRVGGDVGLGLATFGTLYFPIAFVVYYLLFLFYDSLFYRRKGRIVFSFIPLICIFTIIVHTFEVSSGIETHFSNLIYRLPIMLLIYAIIYKIIRCVFQSK